MKKINKKNVARNAALVLGAITTVVMPALAVTACKPEPEVEVPETAHTTIGGVKVYLDGVSAADATTAINRINGLYDGWDSSLKANFADGRITSIRIITGNTAVMDGTVAKIGYQAGSSVLSPFFMGVIASLQRFDTAKETVRMAFAHAKGQRTI